MWHSSLAVTWHVASSWTGDQTHVPTLASRFLTIGPAGRSSKYVSFSRWLAFKDYYQDLFFFSFSTLPLLSLPSLPSLCIVSKTFLNMFKSTNPRFFFKSCLSFYRAFLNIVLPLSQAQILPFFPFRTCKLVTLWQICFIGAVQFF